MSVAVDHPDLGNFFTAVLNLQRSSVPQLANESAGLRILWRCATVTMIAVHRTIGSLCQPRAQDGRDADLHAAGMALSRSA